MLALAAAADVAEVVPDALHAVTGNKHTVKPPGRIILQPYRL